MDRSSIFADLMSLDIAKRSITNPISPTPVPIIAFPKQGPP